MPSGRVHRLDAKSSGYSNKVNEVIDGPYSWLGSKHRVLFHDPLSTMRLGQIVDPENGARGGLRHFILDSAASANPDLKAALEFIAATSSTSRKIRVTWERPKKYRVLRKIYY